MLCLPRKAAFFKQGIFTSLIPLLSPLLSPPPVFWSCSWYFSSAQKAKICFLQSPNKVRTAPCSQQQSSCWVWCFACECVFVFQSVDVCARRGGSYSPSNHLLLQLRRKKKSETKAVCAQECVCVCRIQPLAPPAGFVMAGFPSSSFNL